MTLKFAQLQPPHSGHDRDPKISIDLSSYALDQWPPHESDTQGVGATVRFARHPVSMPVRRKFATVSQGYTEDFYDRIHLIPTRIDLGALVNGQVREVEVWNAFRIPQNLSAITFVDAEGLTLSGPPAPPTVFGALESRLYDLAIDIVGPAGIQASITWTFPGAHPITLQVTGVRAIVFPFRPNWGEGVLERIGWVTDVRASDNDTEQRVSLSADVPRRQIEFTVTLNRDQATAADALIWAWQARACGVPLWWDIARLTAPAAVGALTIACDTTEREFVAGGLIVLTTGDRRDGLLVTESAEVDTVAPGQLTLKRPLTKAWPLRSVVCPALIARLEPQQPVPRVTGGVLSFTVLFSTESERPIAPEVAALTYDGRPVDLRRPNRIRPIEATYGRRLMRLDNGFGPVVVEDLTDRPQVARQHGFVLANRADQIAFRRWLAARRGRQAPMWSPTWQADLRPIEALTDTLLVVAETGAATFLADLPVGRRDILLERNDGTRWIRRVTAIAPGAGVGREELVLDSVLGVTVQPSEWRRVSWLELTRLASDWGEIRHLTATVAEAAVGIQTVTG